MLIIVVVAIVSSDTPRKRCFPEEIAGNHPCTENGGTYCSNDCGTNSYQPCARNYCSSCGCCIDNPGDKPGVGGGCPTGESCYQTGSKTAPQSGTCAMFCDGDGSLEGRCKGVFNEHCHVDCVPAPPLSSQLSSSPAATKGECRCLSCDVGYWGDQCEQCLGVRNNKTCSGRGTCDGSGTSSGDGTCDCEPGWTKASDCSVFTCGEGYGGCAHGDCIGPATCSCEHGWKGKNCDVAICTTACDHGNCTAPDYCQCTEGWAGELCDVALCPGGCLEGACNTPGVCTCKPGWEKADCSVPICTTPCSVHGSCVAPDVCECVTGFTGAGCNIGNSKCCRSLECYKEDENQCGSCCATPEGQPGSCCYGLTPSQCQREYVCRACDCSPCCFTGGNCYARDAPHVPGSGQCCPDNRKGDNCKDCSVGYWGAECNPCPRGTQGEVCAGNGVCDGTGTTNGNGTCACNAGYIGVSCDQCDPSFWNPHCPTTTPGMPCSQHGSCDCGDCSCSHGWDGDDCAVCAVGFNLASQCASCAAGFAGSNSTANPPSLVCTRCDVCVHGVCDGNMTFGTGACLCDSEWAGASCDATSSSSHGMAPGTVVAGIAIGAGITLFCIIALAVIAFIVLYYFVWLPKQRALEHVALDGSAGSRLNRARESMATRPLLLDPASQRGSVAAASSSSASTYRAPTVPIKNSSDGGGESTEGTPHHRPNWSTSSNLDFDSTSEEQSRKSSLAAGSDAPHHRTVSSNFGLTLDFDDEVNDPPPRDDASSAATGGTDGGPGSARSTGSASSAQQHKRASTGDIGADWALDS